MNDTMIAFVLLGDVLIKAYDKGDDWQTIDSFGNERWRSKWRQDVKGSLETAINRHALECGYTQESIVHLIEFVGTV